MLTVEAQQEGPASDPKPRGAMAIVGILGVLTLLLWGSLFSLVFIRG